MIYSEVLNARSTVTARILLVASMVMAAASLLANLATLEVNDLAMTASIERAMHSSTVATVTFALVAGLVSATSDYRFGRIDQLLLSDPRPSRVLRAKTIVGAGIGVLYGVAGGAAALVVLWSFYRYKGVAIELTSSTVLLPLAGAVVASSLFVAIGIGIGTAIRNQPAAVAGGLALLLVVQPPMLLGLPDIGRWLPGAAALSMTLAPDPALLGQVAGGVLLVAWTVLALWAGIHRLQRDGA